MKQSGLNESYYTKIKHEYVKLLMKPLGKGFSKMYYMRHVSILPHIQGPPWHNVKIRSQLTKSEIEMHSKLLHINNSTPQTICFIKQNLKLFQ